MLDELNSTCVEDYKQFINENLWKFIESTLSPKLQTEFNIAFESQFVDTKFPALENVMEEIRNRIPSIVNSAFEMIAGDVDSVSVALEDDKKQEVATIMKQKVGEWIPLVLNDAFKEELKNQLDSYIKEKMNDTATKFRQNGVDCDHVMKELLMGLNERMREVFKKHWNDELKKEKTKQRFEDKKNEMITAITKSLEDIANKAGEEKKKQEMNLTTAMNLPAVPTSLPSVSPVHTLVAVPA